MSIHRERREGHPVKLMMKGMGIPRHRLNDSSFDLPILPSKVLKHAAKFHTATDQEVRDTVSPCCLSLHKV